MLSRTSSDVSTRLRRAKSSSSVTRQRNALLAPERVDPVIAKQHALTAAHIAMERATERASIELRRSTELSRANSTTSKAATSQISKPQSIGFTDSILRIQHSVPFSLETDPMSATTPVCTVSRSDTSNVSAIPQFDDFDYIPPGYGSVPSSYRKLRKAKSMLATRMRSTNHSDPGPDGGNTHATCTPPRPAVGLNVRKSLLFLKPGRFNTPKNTLGQTQPQDVAIQLARDQFLRDLEQQKLKSRPSFLLSSRIRRQHKPFRKSVRSSRTTEEGEEGALQNPSSGHVNIEAKLESKARSLSRSIRNSVRRVFSRSSSGRHELPSQHLNASRLHFREYVEGSLDDQLMECDNESGPIEDELSRRPYYVPTNRKVSIDDLHSFNGSVKRSRSSGSLSNGQSRTTSWTNSTAANTLTTRDTSEKKRLSIIQEHGPPYQPSSSTGRHQTDGYAAFRAPLRIPQGASSLSPAIVDSRRIYSALIRRIDESSTEQSAENISCESPDGAYTAVTTGESQSFSSKRTPHQNEDRLARSSKQDIERPQSSFFPFSSEAKPKTPSPFKLALVASRRETQSSSDEETKSVIISKPRQSDLTSASDSVYSRSISGNTPIPDGSDLGESNSDGGYEPGMATILASRRSRYRTLPGSNCESSHEPKSSGEWKAWTDSQVATLDRQNSQSRQYMAKYRPSHAHYREDAQIDSDDIAVGNGPRSTSSRGGTSQSPSKPRTSMMNERFPLLDLKEVPRKSAQYQGPHRRSSNCGVTTVAADRHEFERPEIQFQKSKRSLNPLTNGARASTSQSQPIVGVSRQIVCHPPSGTSILAPSFTTLHSHTGCVVNGADSLVSGEVDQIRRSNASPPGRSSNNENCPPHPTEGYSDHDDTTINLDTGKAHSLNSRHLVSTFLRSKRRSTGTVDGRNAESVFI